MKTIIQTIGPLYGEVSNGTVFGQPNGSVYTPPANTLSVKADYSATNAYVKNGDTNIVSCRSDGTFGTVATFNVSGQVPYIFISELATDSGFTNIISTSTGTSVSPGFAALGAFGVNSQYTIVSGTTYYARLRIVTVNGQYTMATSDTYTLEGLV